MVPDVLPAEPSPNNTEDESAAKKKERHPVRMVTVFILCALSHILTLRYVSTTATPTVESIKWKPRHLSLTHPPNFTNIEDGSLDLLDKLIVKSSLTIVVYYAPWSRASQKILDNVGQLSPHEGNVSFIAINCWLYKSQCKEAYNSWEYPSIVMYHAVLAHTPYIYSMTTHPPALQLQIQRLATPVIAIKAYKDLIDIAMNHQQTIVGYFDSSDSQELEQYTKAAVQHHFEYMDTYYIPFVSVVDPDFLTIVGVTATPLVFRYQLFHPLEEFESSGFFSARLLLNWVHKKKSLITHLNYRTFPSVLSMTRQSIIFSTPLANNTKLYQDYMRFVMSYRYCGGHDHRRGIYCDQNKTCVNPCTTPNFSSPHSIMSCLQNRPADHLIRQCFSLSTRSGKWPYSGYTLPSRRSNTVGVFGDDCPLLDEISETKHLLNTFLRMRETRDYSSVHSRGCSELGTDGLKFYSLDSVLWYDMLGRFGITNSSRYSEAILKVSSKEQTVQRWSLDGQDSVSFENFVLADNPTSAQQHSGRDFLHSSHIQDVDREQLEEILDVRGLDVVVMTYTTWCGFCKTLWVKVESLAILLEQSPQLKFLSINLDHNELEDVDISTDKIPALYFSFSTNSEIIPFPHNTTLTLTNILSFIKLYVEVETKPRGRFPEPSPSPCARWRPLVLKPSETIHWPHDLGLSDYSIFDVLEDEVDNMMDLNQEEEEREEEREEPIFKIKEMAPPNPSTCDLDKYIIKLLAEHNSDPDRLPPHVQTTLVTNLLSSDCLTDQSEFWDAMIIECYNSVNGYACDHLILAHMVQQFHSASSETVMTVLLSLGRAQFDITKCYNVREELGHYLRGECSKECGRACRLIYKLV